MPPFPSGPLRIAVYSLELTAYACARLRLILPAARAAGQIELLWAVRSDGTDFAIDARPIDQADIILFQRQFPQPLTQPLVDQALRTGKPVVYDLDDLLLELPPEHPFAARIRPNLPHIRDLLAAATVTTVSSHTLCQSLEGLATRLHVLPNLLPETLWKPRPPKTDAPVCIGYAGTSSHLPDLAGVEEALLDIANRHGTVVRFLFYGCATPRLRALRNAEVLPFDAGYEAYARRLSRLGLHIGIAPLHNSAFNRCKSDVKWQEYSACEAAGAYAALPPYTEVVEHGATGMLCGPSPQEWVEALERLIVSPAYRMTIARQARAAVLERRGLALRGACFAEFWRSLVERGQ